MSRHSFATRLLGIFSALSALSACAPRYVMWNPRENPSHGVRASLAEVSFVDKRPSNREIDLPFLTGIGREEFRPALSGPVQDSIRREISRNYAGQGVSEQAQVEILDATVGYKNTFLTERIFGRFRLQIRFRAAGMAEGGCSADVKLEKGVLNTREAVLAKLFEEGLILGAYKCLEYRRQAGDSHGDSKEI